MEALSRKTPDISVSIDTEAKIWFHIDIDIIIRYQHYFTALCTAPVLHSLFPDNLLIKAEDEISHTEERRSSGSSHRKPGRFHSYASSSGRSTQVPDGKSTTPVSKQIRDRQLGQKGHSKASNFTQKPTKGSKKKK